MRSHRATLANLMETALCDADEKLKILTWIENEFERDPTCENLKLLQDQNKLVHETSSRVITAKQAEAVARENLRRIFDD